MWENVMSIALNYGLMAGLFVGLMVYVLKDAAKRERKHMDIISALAEKFKVVEDIQKEIADLKSEIRSRK